MRSCPLLRHIIPAEVKGMECCGNGNELVVLAASLAISISEHLDNSELNILGVFFNALGDNLSVIAAKREACSEHSLPPY